MAAAGIAVDLFLSAIDGDVYPSAEIEGVFGGLRIKLEIIELAIIRIL